MNCEFEGCSYSSAHKNLLEMHIEYQHDSIEKNNHKNFIERISSLEPCFKYFEYRSNLSDRYYIQFPKQDFCNAFNG